MGKQFIGTLVTLAGIILVALIGYFIFLKFMTVFVPNLASFSLIVVAIVAGIAAFFNPCNFAILPAYITYYSSATEKVKAKKEKKVQRRNVLLFGLVAGLGIVAFNLILGSIIAFLGVGIAKGFALAGTDPNVYVRIFRGVVGVALIGFGFMNFTGKGFKWHFIAPKAKIKNPLLGLFSFGFFYNAIGIGCSGPILAGLSIFAFSTGGFYSALFAFLIFSITMLILMFIISLFVGSANEKLLQKVAMQTPQIRKYSGLIIILVGIFLLLSSIFIQQFTGILFPS